MDLLQSRRSGCQYSKSHAKIQRRLIRFDPTWQVNFSRLTTVIGIVYTVFPTNWINNRWFRLLKSITLVTPSSAVTPRPTQLNPISAMPSPISDFLIPPSFPRLLPVGSHCWGDGRRITAISQLQKFRNPPQFCTPVWCDEGMFHDPLKQNKDYCLLAHSEYERRRGGLNLGQWTMWLNVYNLNCAKFVVTN
jgi:hypothetical protein